MVNLALPWEPYYMQSGAAGGGEAAAATGTASTVDSSSLFYRYGLASAVVFTLVVHVIEAYLDGRQRSAYQETQFPKELETTVKEIDMDRVRDINNKKQNSSNTKKTTESTAAAAGAATETQDATATATAATETKDAKSTATTTDTHKPLLPQLQEKFKSAQAYGLDKINFGMIAATYGTMSVPFWDCMPVQ